MSENVTSDHNDISLRLKIDQRLTHYARTVCAASYVSAFMRRYAEAQPEGTPSVLKDLIVRTGEDARQLGRCATRILPDHPEIDKPGLEALVMDAPTEDGPEQEITPELACAGLLHLVDYAGATLPDEMNSVVKTQPGISEDERRQMVERHLHTVLLNNLFVGARIREQYGIPDEALGQAYGQLLHHTQQFLPPDV